MRIVSNDINVLFRYDARNKGKPTLWSEDEPKGFGNRAHFKAHSPNAKLYLENITFNEGGIFRCRVDFQTAQTRNSLFNLTVIGIKYNVLQLNLMYAVPFSHDS